MTDAYWRAHMQVYRIRGKAAGHLCAECRDPAHEWALTNETNAVHGTRIKHRGGQMIQQNATWSEDPYDYTALCRPCHKLLTHGVLPGEGDRHKRAVKNWYVRRAYWKAKGLSVDNAGPRPIKPRQRHGNA